MKKILRATSLLTLITFVGSNLFAGLPMDGVTGSLAVRERPGFLQVEIPENLASIEEFYEAPAKQNPSLILHVQNIHGNYEAQIQIKKLLDYLNKTYGFKQIFVEGAASKLNPEFLKVFADEKQNKEFADYLTRNAQLTGPENYLAEAPADVAAVGIEDAELYRRNLEDFKTVHNARQLIAPVMQELDAKLDMISAKALSKDARTMLGEWKKFESGHRDFLPYAKKLAQNAKKHLGLDLESLFAQVEWPQLTRLLVIQQMEPEVNRDNALKEKTRLVIFLKEQNVSPDIIQAVEKLGEKSIVMSRLDESGQENRLENLPRYLLERLVADAGPKGFFFHDYPAFSLYAGYLILQSELQSRALFEEINLLFEKILNDLAKKEQEKSLIELYRDLDLLKKLMKLELTRKEWGKTDYRKDWLKPSSLQRRIDEIEKIFTERLSEQTTSNSDMDLRLDRQSSIVESSTVEVEKYFRVALNFYDYARKREDGFIRSIEKNMVQSQSDKAVLVTGGFHTDGLMDMFRERQINYGVLMPRMTQNVNDVENKYIDTMLEKNPTMFDLATIEQANLIGDLVNPAARFYAILESFIFVGDYGSPAAVINWISTINKIFSQQGFQLEVNEQNQVLIKILNPQIAEALKGKNLKVDTVGYLQNREGDYIVGAIAPKVVQGKSSGYKIESFRAQQGVSVNLRSETREQQAEEGPSQVSVTKSTRRFFLFSGFKFSLLSMFIAQFAVAFGAAVIMPYITEYNKARYTMKVIDSLAKSNPGGTGTLDVKNTKIGMNFINAESLDPATLKNTIWTDTNINNRLAASDILLSLHQLEDVGDQTAPEFLGVDGLEIVLGSLDRGVVKDYPLFFRVEIVRMLDAGLKQGNRYDAEQKTQILEALKGVLSASADNDADRDWIIQTAAVYHNQAEDKDKARQDVEKVLIRFASSPQDSVIQLSQLIYGKIGPETKRPSDEVIEAVLSKGSSDFQNQTVARMDQLIKPSVDGQVDVKLVQALTKYWTLRPAGGLLSRVVMRQKLSKDLVQDVINGLDEKVETVNGGVRTPQYVLGQIVGSIQELGGNKETDQELRRNALEAYVKLMEYEKIDERMVGQLVAAVKPEKTTGKHSDIAKFVIDVLEEMARKGWMVALVGSDVLPKDLSSVQGGLVGLAKATNVITRQSNVSDVNPALLAIARLAFNEDSQIEPNIQIAAKSVVALLRQERQILTGTAVNGDRASNFSLLAGIPTPVEQKTFLAQRQMGGPTRAEARQFQPAVETIQQQEPDLISLILQIISSLSSANPILTGIIGVAAIYFILNFFVDAEREQQREFNRLTGDIEDKNIDEITAATLSKVIIALTRTQRDDLSHKQQQTRVAAENTLNAVMQFILDEKPKNSIELIQMVAGLDDMRMNDEIDQFLKDGYRDFTAAGRSRVANAIYKAQAARRAETRNLSRRELLTTTAKVVVGAGVTVASGILNSGIADAAPRKSAKDTNPFAIDMTKPDLSAFNEKMLSAFKRVEDWNKLIAYHRLNVTGAGSDAMTFADVKKMVDDKTFGEITTVKGLRALMEILRQIRYYAYQYAIEEEKKGKRGHNAENNKVFEFWARLISDSDFFEQGKGRDKLFGEYSAGDVGYLRTEYWHKENHERHRRLQNNDDASQRELVKFFLIRNFLTDDYAKLRVSDEYQKMLQMQKNERLLYLESAGDDQKKALEDLKIGDREYLLEDGDLSWFSAQFLDKFETLIDRTSTVGSTQQFQAAVQIFHQETGQLLKQFRADAMKRNSLEAFKNKDEASLRELVQKLVTERKAAEAEQKTRPRSEVREINVTLPLTALTYPAGTDSQTASPASLGEDLLKKILDPKNAGKLSQATAQTQVGFISFGLVVTSQALQSLFDMLSKSSDSEVQKQLAALKEEIGALFPGVDAFSKAGIQIITMDFPKDPTQVAAFEAEVEQIAAMHALNPYLATQILVKGELKYQKQLEGILEKAQGVKDSSGRAVAKRLSMTLFPNMRAAQNRLGNIQARLAKMVMQQLNMDGIEGYDTLTLQQNSVVLMMGVQLETVVVGQRVEGVVDASGAAVDLATQGFVGGEGAGVGLATLKQQLPDILDAAADGFKINPTGLSALSARLTSLLAQAFKIATSA